MHNGPEGLNDEGGLAEHCDGDVAGRRWMRGFELPEFAARHPDRVSELVYLDAGYDWTNPRWAEAGREWPFNVVLPESALVSLDAFRSWIRSGVFSDVDWSDALEADVRGMTRLSADGSVQASPRPNTRASPPETPPDTGQSPLRSRRRRGRPRRSAPSRARNPCSPLLRASRRRPYTLCAP